MADQAVLPPSTASARDARHFVGDTLRHAGAAEAAEVAELLVTELVTNAVLHAAGEVVVRVACRPERVRIEVADGSASRPVRLSREPDATTGRGLVLVEALAAAWGIQDEGAGKAVWFELAAGDGS